MTDQFDLNRFLLAQSDIYDTVIPELQSGRKRSHWIWFIFPQIDGLAQSETAHRFAIKSVAESREYLDHPVLGARLKECVKTLLDLGQRSVSEIFDYPDDLKFHSSITLFALVAGGDSVFQSVLNKYFDGQPDDMTLRILQRFDVSGVTINIAPNLTESDIYGIFAYRVAKSGKDKCGDSFAVKFLKDEQILLMAVADGVSSCPCDWKASEVACEVVMGKFKVCDGSIAERMAAAAKKAHNAVRQISGSCAGSITSLTLVAWETHADEIHVLNVGDSRAYLGPDNDLEQITTDDVQPVLLKRNGEVILQAGVPVFMRGVTRSLGQTESLEFSVQTHPFLSNNLLMLVSDGICKNEAFTMEFPKIFSSANIEQKLSELVCENSQRNSDDATLIAVWRKPIDDGLSSALLEDCLCNITDFRMAGLTPLQMAEFIKVGLVKKMEKDRNDEANSILDYAEEFEIRLDRDFLGAFLSRVIRQGSDKPLIARIRELIRSAYSR